MARPDRTLTVRGRAFLAAGVTTTVCGLVLTERDLARMGILVAVAPLAALLYVATRRVDLTARREASPPSVRAGQSARVEVALVNSRRASAVLGLEERLPYALGTRPRFTVDPLAPGQGVTLDYELRPEVRGRYLLGPLQVRMREPFGMAESLTTLPGETELVVTPATVPLPGVDLSGGWFGAGGEQARSYAQGDVADATVRDYRRGDDLRRVHWRTTARVGDLMVRREEQPMQSSATVVLDNRSLAHAGRGDTGTFERAIVAVASVIVHLAENGFLVRLVTASGTMVGEVAGGHLDAYPLLRHLATLQLTSASTWPADVDLADDGLVVAVVAAAGSAHQGWAARVPGTSTRGLALLVTTDPASRLWLEKSGWRVAQWAPGENLRAAWQAVGS